MHCAFSKGIVLQALGPEALIPLTLLAPQGSCAMLCGDPRYPAEASCQPLVTTNLNLAYSFACQLLASFTRAAAQDPYLYHPYNVFSDQAVMEFVIQMITALVPCAGGHNLP